MSYMRRGWGPPRHCISWVRASYCQDPWEHTVPPARSRLAAATAPVWIAQPPCLLAWVLRPQRLSAFAWGLSVWRPASRYQRRRIVSASASTLSTGTRRTTNSFHSSSLGPTAARSLSFYSFLIFSVCLHQRSSLHPGQLGSREPSSIMMPRDRLALVLIFLVASVAPALALPTGTALYASPPGLDPTLARAITSSPHTNDSLPVWQQPLGTAADDGVNTPEYRLCVESRYRDVCGPDGVDDGVTGRVDPDLHRDPSEVRWSLRVTQWNCLSDTQYRCTHTLTNDAQQRVQSIRSNALLQAQSAAGPGTSYASI